MVEAEDPRIGALVDGRYRLEAVLGAGGMGAVYRATQAPLGRPVALKMLHAGLGRDPKIAQRFELEARALARLRHPHLVTLIDFGRTPEGELYLVTELLEGRSLDRVLTEGPLSEARTLRLLRGVAEALDEAHAAGVVHRDIKPANLFLETRRTGEGVRLLDFGIARILEEDRITSAGSTTGTGAYMAPEQARGRDVDGRADLYSLGVVAYECLVGRRPFRATTPMSQMLAHVQEPPEPIGPAHGVSAPVAALVMELLAKRAGDRPGSARALVDRIDALLGPTETGDPGRSTASSLEGAKIEAPTAAADRPPATAATPPVGTAPGRRSRRPALALGLLVLVGAWAVGSGSAPRRAADLADPAAAPSVGASTAPAEPEAAGAAGALVGAPSRTSSAGARPEAEAEAAAPARVAGPTEAARPTAAARGRRAGARTRRASELEVAPVEAPSSSGPSPSAPAYRAAVPPTEPAATPSVPPTVSPTRPDAGGADAGPRRDEGFRRVLTD